MKFNEAALMTYTLVITSTLVTVLLFSTPIVVTGLVELAEHIF